MTSKSPNSSDSADEKTVKYPMPENPTEKKPAEGEDNTIEYPLPYEEMERLLHAQETLTESVRDQKKPSDEEETTEEK